MSGRPIKCVIVGDGTGEQEARGAESAAETRKTQSRPEDLRFNSRTFFKILISY